MGVGWLIWWVCDLVLGGGFVIWFWVGVICGGPIVVGLLVAAMVEVFFFFFLAVVGGGEWMWICRWRWRGELYLFYIKKFLFLFWCFVDDHFCLKLSLTWTNLGLFMSFEKWVSLFLCKRGLFGFQIHCFSTFSSLFALNFLYFR